MSQLLTSQVLHEQLSVIMAALTKAAVLDIYELLERGLAGLRDEVNRSQQENRELRSRLSLIESVVARGSFGGPCPDIPEDARHQPERQRDHREGQADGEAPDCVEEVPDVVLIKDEDSDSEEEYVMSAVDMEDVTEDVATTTPPLTRKRKRKGQEKDSDRKSGFTGAVSMAAVYSLDAAQLDVDDVAAAESSACEKADAYLVQGDACLPTADQLADFPNVALPQSHPSENVCWSEPVSNDVTSAGFQPTDAFGLQIVSVSGSALPDSAAAAAVEYREGKASGKGRRHVCGVCNKTFATAQSRDVHTRIHTGERPFRCQHCGRRFTQAAHLKSHLNIHTGERPFACLLCPSTFLTKHTLNVHLKKWHADT